MKYTIWYNKVFSQRKHRFLGVELFIDNDNAPPEYEKYTVELTDQQAKRMINMLNHVKDSDGVSFIEIQLYDLICHIRGIKQSVVHTDEWKTRIGEYRV